MRVLEQQDRGQIPEQQDREQMPERQNREQGKVNPRDREQMIPQKLRKMKFLRDSRMW